MDRQWCAKCSCQRCKRYKASLIDKGSVGSNGAVTPTAPKLSRAHALSSARGCRSGCIADWADCYDSGLWRWEQGYQSCRWAGCAGVSSSCGRCWALFWMSGRARGVCGGASGASTGRWSEIDATGHVSAEMLERGRRMKDVCIASLIRSGPVAAGLPSVAGDSYGGDRSVRVRSRRATSARRRLLHVARCGGKPVRLIALSVNASAF